MNQGRVEAFSDGIFAIAITLLVLTIALPDTAHYNDLARQLGQRWPSLAAYVVSFLVIGIMWVNHHTVFTHLRAIDRGMFYCNLLLLMTIVFIPYPTEVFGVALRLGAGARTAAIFYSVAMTVNACMWALLWLYASIGRRLLSPDFPESQRTISTILFTAGTGAYGASIVVAVFFTPFVCLAFHGALALYYAFDPISRRVGRETDRSAKPGASMGPETLEQQL
jgi:uncharacterized membrane protein